MMNIIISIIKKWILVNKIINDFIKNFENAKDINYIIIKCNYLNFL